MFFMQLASYWNNWEAWLAKNDERSQSDFILKKEKKRLIQRRKLFFEEKGWVGDKNNNREESEA